MLLLLLFFFLSLIHVDVIVGDADVVAADAVVAIVVVVVAAQVVISNVVNTCDVDIAVVCLSRCLLLFVYVFCFFGLRLFVHLLASWSGLVFLFVCTRGAVVIGEYFLVLVFFLLQHVTLDLLLLSYWLMMMLVLCILCFTVAFYALASIFARVRVKMISMLPYCYCTCC